MHRRAKSVWTLVLGWSLVSVTIAGARAQDCNNNEIPDRCDIDCGEPGGECDVPDCGQSEDCNGNLIPDECELGVVPFEAVSPDLSPLDHGRPQTFVLPSPPFAVGDVTLIMAASADFGDSDEAMDVYLNRRRVGSAFNGGRFSDCVEREVQLVLRADQFNSYLHGGDAIFYFYPTSQVNRTTCYDRSYVRLSVSYPAVYDCDGNDSPDDCDLREGRATDCDGNGKPDGCDITLGAAEDFNENLRLDVCEPVRTWFVDDDARSDPGPGDPEVSDPNEDGSPRHPYDAVQEAVDRAIYGDTVLLADGTYTGIGNRRINFGGRSITVRGASGPEDCVIDCQGADHAFFFERYNSLDMRVENVTIKNGVAPFNYGGAIYSYESSPTISGCIISNCTASRRGGGLYLDQSFATVRDCLLTGNSAGDNGGAIHSLFGHSVIERCRMVGNRSDGGAGAALYVRLGRADVSRCEVFENESRTGGGLYLVDFGGSVRDCVIRDNHGTGSPGGVAWSGGEATMTGCTVVGNTSGDGVGGMVCSGGNGSVASLYATGANNVFWRNTGSVAGQIALVTTGAHISLAYNTIEGGRNGVVVQFGELQWGEGNLQSDPGFIGPDDLRLSPDSPLINAGDPAFAAPPGARDFDGVPRVLCGRVDMGAYEFGIGDYTCDRLIDLADYRYWPECMTGPAGDGYPDGCEAFDFDANATVDLEDVRGFQQVFQGP